jgi:inosose dehydratase
MMLRREFIALLAAAARKERIRFGCQTRVYGVPIRDRARLLEILGELASYGYEGFETNINTLLPRFNNPAPDREDFLRRRVPLIALHLGASLFDAAKVESEQEQIAQAAKAVKEFGGTHLMLSGNKLPDSKDSLRRKIRELNRAGKAAQQAGVILCSHNHGPELENDGYELRAQFEETDPALVSMVFDVGNPFPPGLEAVAIVRKYAQRIRAFHLRDTREGKEVLMGTGEFDFAELATALRDTNWGGWLIVEENRQPGKTSGEQARAAKQYLERKMSL